MVFELLQIHCVCFWTSETKSWISKTTYIDHLELLVKRRLISNCTHLTLDLLCRHVTHRHYAIMILLLLHLLHVELIVQIVVQLWVHCFLDVALCSGRIRLDLLYSLVKSLSTYIFGQGQMLLNFSVSCKFWVVVVSNVRCCSCPSLHRLVVFKGLDLLDRLLQLDRSDIWILLVNSGLRNSTTWCRNFLIVFKSRIKSPLLASSQVWAAVLASNLTKFTQTDFKLTLFDWMEDYGCLGKV